MLPTSRTPLTTYMITSAGAEVDILAAVSRALRLGVDLVQLRRPGASARALQALVERCARLEPRARERLLVNDRLDVALASGIAGVHLPATGLPVAAVRRRAPAGFRIGVSTHTGEEVRRAAEEGASFVVFGPVFPTSSKPGHPGLGLDALASAARSSPIPVFALGGVAPERLADIVAAGASGVAGISSFEDESRLVSLLSWTRGRAVS